MMHRRRSRQSFRVQRIFAQISPNLPVKTPKKKQKKNVCTLILGAIFVTSKYIKRFCEGFHTFCPNFHRFCPDFKGFCPDFHHIKSFGVHLHPLHPNLLHQCHNVLHGFTNSSLTARLLTLKREVITFSVAFEGI